MIDATSRRVRHLSPREIALALRDRPAAAEALEKVVGIARRARQSWLASVDRDEAKLWTVAVGPLPVVSQRPVYVPGHGDTSSSERGEREQVLDDVRWAQNVGGVGDAVLGDDVADAARLHEPGLRVVLVPRVEVGDERKEARGEDAAARARVLDLVRLEAGGHALDHLLAVVVEAAKVNVALDQVDEKVL
eukprot:6189278-Pleurochrysis_carterae.AAC.6